MEEVEASECTWPQNQRHDARAHFRDHDAGVSEYRIRHGDRYRTGTVDFPAISQRADYRWQQIDRCRLTGSPPDAQSDLSGFGREAGNGCERLGHPNVGRRTGRGPFNQGTARIAL